MVPWPPHLGRQDSIISIEWHAKVRANFEHTNGQNLFEDFSCVWSSSKFGPKAGLNLSENLFYFFIYLFVWSWLKTGLNLSRETFFLVFSILKFPALPPPLENSAYASDFMSRRQN